MRMSKMYMPTLRETPAEAEIASHQYLLRAGLTRRLVSGIYSYLPLGYRVIRKVEEVIREEMDRADSQEILMSAVQPKEIWEATGRWYDFGPEMFKLKDRNSREFCLGPTHEEYLTNMIKGEIRSYKQLPLSLYQIQTKYRDEVRPRFGFIRAREFIMKDAYTFDTSKENMEKAYKVQWEAYDRVFTRLGLKYKVVQGDSGAMGGNNSHEFMALSETGESLIAYCNDCDYAATDEKAEVVYRVGNGNEEEKELEKIHTPGASTIEDLEKIFHEAGNKFAKALVYEAAGEPVVCIVPGDRQLSEVKLINHLGLPEHEVEMASDELIRDISSADVGFTGPIGLKEGTRILVDSRIREMKNLVVGANETDYHIVNANYGRDFQGELVKDLLLIEDGDICPVCNKPLYMERGIEVGNIFQLGKKYSEGLNATFLDEDGKAQHFWMGSYGIGVSRTVSAIIEQNHDDKGIIWPMIVAPYHVIITVISNKDEAQMELAEKIYDDLKSFGLEVLLDDRSERPGVKFNDRDLIGIPARVTVGRDAKDGLVEFSLRSDGENKNVSAEELRVLIDPEYEVKRLPF